MDDSDSLSDIEGGVPKLTFEELKQQALNKPKQMKNRKDLLQTMYYFCKDQRKHSRIIKILFWPLIVSFIEDQTSNQISLYGLKILNLLIANQGTHDQVLKLGEAKILEKSSAIQHMLEKSDHINTFLVSQDKDQSPLKQQQSHHQQTTQERTQLMHQMIQDRQDPIRIITKKIMDTESTLIMNEATKALSYFSITDEVLKRLKQERALLEIVHAKFLDADPQSQENLLMTIAASCADSCQHFKEFRKEYVDNPQFLDILFSQVKSISTRVTYQTLKIFKYLSQDELSLQKLQDGNQLRLSQKLIYTFHWLDAKTSENPLNKPQNPSSLMITEESPSRSTEKQISNELTDLIFREIAETFMNILKYYDIHRPTQQAEKLPQKETNNLQAASKSDNQQVEEEDPVLSTERHIIETIILLGRQSQDTLTTLYTATSLAHITEILNFHGHVASKGAITFMIDMLKDAKNLEHHRQGCRYFANLSFYKDYRDDLIGNDIATYLLKAIEGQMDEDTIKHSAIALANLSSHKDFMKHQQKSNNNAGVNAIGSASQQQHQQSLLDEEQNKKSEHFRIKPLIHLLDSAQVSKINLIQSACITLCNMASKPQLHQHFVHEPEISTIKNCLSNPIDKEKGNELTRFMIKLVCNLTKNPEILPHLSKKGFLEILFDLLDHEKEKEIFGNVVTAISYLSVQKECQEKIIKNKIIQKILEPLTQIHEVDQKLIVIALTSMLFNGIDLQKEFIVNGGLGKLLFFMQQKDKIFQQLACKCFSLLSENQENLQEIIDQECLNTIIISCLRTQDIDLETLKEITKIFINLILWRKLKRETIETTCCLCDIGLMIKDIDMNILAMFCLNALSENEQSHEAIKSSCIDEQVIGGGGSNGSGANTSFGGGGGGKLQIISPKVSASSIFTRINNLLSLQEERIKKDQDSKGELLVILITSFYLNLARNSDNIEFLLKLELFKQLNSLMQSLIQTSQITDSTALCYTNTIFAKLLKDPKARKFCIEEQGYQLFISILKTSQSKHLFLETLDSIKLFLTQRDYLSKFSAIPSCLILSSDCHELNVSFLQVIAILSFDKRNHQAIKQVNILKKLQEHRRVPKGQRISEETNLFDEIFDYFEQQMEEQEKKQMYLKEQQKSNKGGNPFAISLGIKQKSQMSSSQQDLGNGGSKKKKEKQKKEENTKIEMALAISIILANLSCDLDFITSLLGAQKWAQELTEQEQNLQDYNSNNGGDKKKVLNGMGQEISQRPRYKEGYNEDNVAELQEVLRIKQLFELLAHENKFISEQISILLANISNSCYFSHILVTDRCMKAIVKILRRETEEKPSESSLLAILIAVLNLSSLKEIIIGVERLKFMPSLEMIIQDQSLPMVNKSIALLAISNIYTFSKRLTVSESTKELAFGVLERQKEQSSGNGKEEEQEVVKNLIYSSIVLLYNIILKNQDEELKSFKLQNKLLSILVTTIQNFTDTQIINAILEVITLFTRDKETADLIFQSTPLLQFTFQNLENPNTQTLKLSALALSRLAASLQTSNSQLFIENLRKFSDFKKVVEVINQNEKTLDSILKYFLNFLENVTSFQRTRDELNCQLLFEQGVKLYSEQLSIENKISLVNILFNLNFNLQEPVVLDKNFLKQLYSSYKSKELEEREGEEAEKTKRKIVVLVVSASANHQNHKNIIKCNFYTQFKRNINDQYERLLENSEEVELFGLVNIALNKRYLDLIYQDLQKIHMIALKNDKIDFKTKVDLFSETAKFLAKIQVGQNGGNRLQVQTGNNGNGGVQKQQAMVDHCLKALLFSIIQLITQLDKSKFSLFKYFLQALLDCTKELKTQLFFLIATDKLIDFLLQVYKQDYEFQMTEFEDHVLNFSLRVIVSEVFFALKQDRSFFKVDQIVEIITLMIKFAQKVITMNIEKKMTLVSNTLRLLSQMIASIHSQDDSDVKIIQTQAVDFVKQSLMLNKDLQPCINIDALFCLANMMNIEKLALNEQLANEDTVNNALIIYFAYSAQVDLDECIITFLYSISKYYQYQQFIKGDKSRVLFFLMGRHLDQTKPDFKESCRKKIFATVHNMTEKEDICQHLHVQPFIEKVDKLFLEPVGSEFKQEHIHELALKSLINICKHTTDSLEEVDLKGIFNGIAHMYTDMKPLSKQYSLRLVTILTKHWGENKLLFYFQELTMILGKFLFKCESMVEMRLVLLNLERIGSSRKLIKQVADSDCSELVQNIAMFIEQFINTTDQEFQQSIEQLFKFIKKLSKQKSSYECIVKSKVHLLALDYIYKSPPQNFTTMEEKLLRQHLTTIQNVMKLVKNIHELSSVQEEKDEIFDKVTAYDDVINVASSLLASNQNNEDLPIMIVNIIICYNQISNKLEANKVKNWIRSFIQRLIEASKPDFPKKQFQQWYMEKYVFILDLLITKNLDKVDKEITQEVLKILEIDSSSFTKTIWYRLLKILAYLQFLQEIATQDSQQLLDQIFKFIIQAYEKAGENLCFYYYMKVVLLIVKKVDNNAQFKTNKNYQAIFQSCCQFLRANSKEKQDNLVLEILLYLIDFFKFLMSCNVLYQHLNQNEIIQLFIEMLQVHENPHLIKALTSALLDASKITVFYPDLLNDTSLSIILQKMIVGSIDPKSLEYLSESLNKILLSTKVPVKYLIAAQILKLTENKQGNGGNTWRDKDSESVEMVLRVLHTIITSLEDHRGDLLQNNQQSDNLETFQDLSQKALKYALISSTNILLKHNTEQLQKNLLIKPPKSIQTIVQVLVENSQFEQDPQVCLRVLWIVNIALDQKEKWKEMPQQVFQMIMDYAYGIIKQFKDILEMKDSYAQVPLQSAYPFQQQKIQQLQDLVGSREQQQKDKEQEEEKVVGERMNSPKSQERQPMVGIKVGRFATEEATENEDKSLNTKNSDTLSQKKEDLLSEKDSIDCSNQQCSDFFYFEKEEIVLKKIDGIRIALCLALDILYKLSMQKKKQNCVLMTDHEYSQDVLKFLYSYYQFRDHKALSQVKKVIKLIQNCSEFVLPEKQLMKESIVYLTKVAERALGDNFSIVDESEEKQSLLIKQQKRKIIKPILQIFLTLTSAQTKECHWQLTKYESRDILLRMKESSDPEIADPATEVCEKVIDNNFQADNPVSMTEQEFAEEIQSIVQASTQTQLQVIKKIENTVVNQLMKVDKLQQKEIQTLFTILQQDPQQPNSKDSEDLKQLILSIFNFLYSQRYLNLREDQKVIQLRMEEEGNSNGQFRFNSRTYFLQIQDLATKYKGNRDILEKVAEFLNLYSKSEEQSDDLIQGYLVDTQILLLDSQKLSQQTFTLVCETLIRLLKISDSKIHLNPKTPKLLLSLVQNQSPEQSKEDIILNLELITKLIFHHTIQLNQDLILFLDQLFSQPLIEFKRIGFFTLYCISLNFGDQERYQWIEEVFKREGIRKALFYVLEQQSHQQTMTAESSPGNSQHRDQSLQKLISVSIQILVNYLEIAEKQQSSSQTNLVAQTDLAYYLVKYTEDSEDIELRKLCQRGLASISFDSYLQSDLKLQSEEEGNSSGLTLMRIFKMVSKVIKSYRQRQQNEDIQAETVYFSLFSLFNILSNIQIQTQQQQQQQQQESNSIKQISSAQLRELVKESDLITSLMTLPSRTNDDDILRLCLKAFTSVVLKTNIKELKQSHQQNTSTWDQFGMSRENGETQIKNLIHKLQSFELQNSYVHYLVTISQLLMQEGGLQVLPSQEQFTDILTQMLEIEQPQLAILVAQNQVACKSALLKLFFQAYLLQIMLQKYQEHVVDSELVEKFLFRSLQQLQQQEQNKKYEQILGGNKKAIPSIQNILLLNLQLLQGSGSSISAELIEILISTLVNNEENKEIVMRTYNILEGLIDKQDSLQVMENSKPLLKMGIKHAAVYQSKDAYTFIEQLTSKSNKYRGRPEVERALKSLKR